MADISAPTIEREAAEVSDTPSGDVETRLVVDVDGFEGPLDVLLVLARTQKVDLTKISILQLVEQYLAFVAAARDKRIELAADYLVMAAWLAFLKSRLLLPPEEVEEGPTAEDMAAHLAFQLERLEAMRRAAAELMGRDQLGRDFFARGSSEDVVVSNRTEWSATLMELLRAYSRVRTKDAFSPLHVEKRAEILTMDVALERMRSLIPAAIDWADLASFLPADWQMEPKKRRSAMASAFAATLELAKQGQIELRQTETYAPLFVRKKD